MQTPHRKGPGPEGAGNQKCNHQTLNVHILPNRTWVWGWLHSSVILSSQTGSLTVMGCWIMEEDCNFFFLFCTFWRILWGSVVESWWRAVVWLQSSAAWSEMGNALSNASIVLYLGPFLIINKERGVKVHLLLIIIRNRLNESPQ